MKSFLYRVAAVGLWTMTALAPSASAAVPSVALPAPALPSAPEAPPAEVRIAFHAESVVQGENYTVGDVAAVTCADPSVRKRVESVVLGPCPYLGTALPLDARLLTYQLERQGISGEGVALRFPDRMVVRRASQEVDLTALRKAIENQLRSRLGQNQENVVIENIQLPASVSLPAGELSCRTEFRLPSRNLGLAAFSADLMVDGVRRRRVSGTLRLDRQVETLQLVSEVSRGAPVGVSACKATPARLSSLRGKPLLAEDLEANLTARRNLPVGTVLTWSEVEKQKLVRRGQMVRMVLESAGGMKISTQGQARTNGAYGDLVEVVNVSSGKKVQGIVAGDQLVRVPF